MELKEQEMVNLVDEGIERAVLSCLIQNPSLIADLYLKLEAGDFFNTNNSYLYKIMLAIYKKEGLRTSFDLSTMLSLAKGTGAEEKFLKEAGGEEYIGFLSIVKQHMIDISKISAYSDRIKELSTKRKLLEQFNISKEQILKSDLSISDLLDKQKENVKRITSHEDSGIKTINLSEAMNVRIDSGKEIKIGNHVFDKTNVFTPKTVNMITSRTGEGKTTFAFNLVRDILINNKEIDVLFLESTSETSDQGLSILLKSVLKDLSEENKRRAEIHYFSPYNSLNELKSLLDKVKDKKGKYPEVLFIDTFEKLTNFELFDYRKITQYLSSFVKETGICCFCLSQTSSAEIKNYKGPKGIYTGSIQQGGPGVLNSCDTWTSIRKYYDRLSGEGGTKWYFGKVRDFTHNATLYDKYFDIPYKQLNYSIKLGTLKGVIDEE